MSVRTKADEQKDEAIHHIDKSIKHLMESLDVDTWGNEDFNDDFIVTMEESVLKLIRIKRDLV